jgi:hypothetical protein
MAAATDILEIRFYGNDVNPGSVKPHEIADLIRGFEKAILSEIKDKFPQYDTEELLFSFEEIKNESLGLLFKPKLIRDVIVSTFTLISTSFQTGDFSGINNKTIKELKTFTSFSKKYNCSADFNLDGVTLSSFSPQTEIPYNKNPIIDGEINLFGRIIDAGGDNPNVHLKLNDEQVIIFSTTEANAKELAHKLYEKVNLSGTAKWDAVTFEIKDFKLDNILDFAAGKTFNAINELKSLSTGFWDNFNTNEDINNQLLRD